MSHGHPNPREGDGGCHPPLSCHPWLRCAQVAAVSRGSFTHTRVCTEAHAHAAGSGLGRDGFFFSSRDLAARREASQQPQRASARRKTAPQGLAPGTGQDGVPKEK